MAGVQKMKVSCENNIVTVDGVNDFTLSQILECGQCFHFDKLDEEVYEVVAFGRAVKMEQTDKVLRIYGSSMEDYEGIWKLYLDMDNDYGLIKQSVIKADGAVDGAGAGDRRKVVAHQHRSLGGDIVHAVLQLMGRGGPGVIHAPLLGKPSAVEDVTYDQNDNANGKN